MPREQKPTFDPEYIRNISEKVYRMNLIRDSGEGAPERMIFDDKDDGRKLRNRAGAYDKLTRTYLKVFGFEPPALTPTTRDDDVGHSVTGDRKS